MSESLRCRHLHTLSDRAMDHDQRGQSPSAPLVISAIWWVLILYASLSVLLDNRMATPLG
jgi:hypothetical protein